MSRIYRISPQKAEVERKKSLKISLMFLAVLFAGILVFTPTMKGLDGRTTLPLLLFMGGLFVVIMFRQIRTVNRGVRKTIESFELEVDESSITRRYIDAPTVTINFSEITAIEERAQGTRIKTAESNR